MANKLKLFIFSLLFLTLATSFVYAKASALEAVLAFPEKFNEKEVWVKGEVIGEPLKNAQGVWINITSDSKQIGVFSSDRGIIEKITYWGSYRETGDQVRIKGIFYKECPVHQTRDVHLETLEIVKKGHRNEHPISAQKQQLAKILSVICLVTAFIYLTKLKYGKRA